jgi:RNase P/RNase MRP subunit POP5
MIKPLIKQKPLLPVLREKKRYIAYQLHADVALPRSSGHLIVTDIKRILGVFDAAKAGVLSIAFDETTKRGVLRTSVQSAPKVRAALLLMSTIHNQKVMVQPLLMSGMVAKMKQVM